MPFSIGTPMTLGNMRANGIQSLGIYCARIDYHHAAALDVSGFQIEFRCHRSARAYQRCGHLGADARPIGSDRSAPRLDYRCLALTDGSFAFASATSNAQTDNGSADENQDFFHDAPQ